MSLPSASGWHHAWAAVVRDAITSTGRTVRLCVILLMMGLSSVTPFLIVALVHYSLG
jgi:hypothetical protein